MVEESTTYHKVNPENWVSHFGDILYQYCLARVNDKMKAEDLVQDTFLSALKGLAGFKGKASEKTWLFSILKNKIIDHYRRQAADHSKNSVAELLNTEDDWFSENGEWKMKKQPTAWSTTESPAEKKELRRLIYDCKQNLTEQLNLVFTLKYIEDLKSEIICKELGINSSNYWVLLHRSRLQMRDCIEKNWKK